MKTALEILASLSPVERDLATQPYTAAEVRRIADDEMLSVNDRRTLLDYADHLAHPPWWASRYISDPDELPEAKAYSDALKSRSELTSAWLKESMQAHEQRDACDARIARLKEKLIAEQAKRDEADSDARHFGALFLSAPDAQESQKLAEVYYEAKRALRKPETPSSGN